MNVTETIKFNKLQKENEKIKKEIEELKNWIQNGGCHQHIEKLIEDLEDEIEKLKSKQLFKEDLTIINETRTKMIIQMDKEKYNFLESKGEK